MSRKHPIRKVAIFAIGVSYNVSSRWVERLPKDLVLEIGLCGFYMGCNCCAIDCGMKISARFLCITHGNPKIPWDRSKLGRWTHDKPMRSTIALHEVCHRASDRPALQERKNLGENNGMVSPLPQLRSFQPGRHLEGEVVFSSGI